MSRRLSLLAAAVAAALAIALPHAGSAQDACSTSAQQRQCSIECCGRWTCAPSCQASCVRACIDACRLPAKQGAYRAQLGEMRRLCGYSNAPAKVAPR
jgi:hypothetical protein